MMGSYCPTDDDIRKVLALCPDFDAEVIKKDLLYVTQNVEATVNRIFDGNIDTAVHHQTSAGISTFSESRQSRLNILSHELSTSDSDDDLPSIPVPKKKRASVKSCTVTKSDLKQSSSYKGSSDSEKCCKFPQLSSNTGTTGLHKTVDLSSDSEESVTCLTTTSGNVPCELSSDDDCDSLPPLPSLSERFQDKKTSLVNRTSVPNKFLSSAKLKALEILCSDSDSNSSNDSDTQELLSFSHHLISGYSSHSSSGSSLPSFVPYNKPSQVSTAASSVSTYGDSQETVSSVRTMDSQYSNEDLSGQSKAKKKKRSPAEIAEQKRLAEQKKQNRAKEMLLKKQQKEFEKAEKKAAQDARRCMQPGECLKYVTVKFDSHILQSTVGPILLKLLQDAGIQYEIKIESIPACVTWTRRKIDHGVQGMALQELSREVDEDYGILVVPVQDFVSMVHGTVNVGLDRISLPEFACQASESLGNKKLSLVVQGMEKYYRDIKTIGQRQFKEAVRSTDPSYNSKKKQKGIDISIIISRFDMEQALLELQLSPAGCSVSLVETPEEVAKVVFRQTKAVAEAPFKREKNQPGFSFLPENKNCAKIDKDGHGLLKLWKQQLCQFHNLSPEIANSIVAEYPSPRLLIKAYEKCPTQREGERLLEDIRVRRGAGVLETSRRVGKEMSRRIYELFMGRDPISVIN